LVVIPKVDGGFKNDGGFKVGRGFAPPLPAELDSRIDPSPPAEGIEPPGRPRVTPPRALRSV